MPGQSARLCQLCVLSERLALLTHGSFRCSKLSIHSARYDTFPRVQDLPFAGNDFRFLGLRESGERAFW